MDGLRVQLNRRKSNGANGAGSGFRSPPVQRSDQLQVTLRGWLYRLEGAAIKQWKRRWFVLGEYCLFNYKDTDEEKLVGSILLPSYRVSPCLASEDGITRKYAFKLEHQNMKTYFLAADSKESMTQWMNALSLASIMQVNALKSPLSAANASPNSSCPLRNRPDGQDVEYTKKGERNERGEEEEEEEEESGFVSYKPRRMMSVSTSNSFLGSGDKYPGSYNSVGLPTISYPTNYQMSHQKRSHYANAPPKPRRQQTGDSIYDYSDNYLMKNYTIPPGAQYHQTHLTGSGPAPDLIAHNTANNGNYLPSLSYAGFYAHHRNHMNNRHNERTSVTSPLSSPSSPTSSNAHYSALPVSRLNNSHHEPLQSYIAPPSQFRMLTRPHSADFLERDHEDETAVDGDVFYDRRSQQEQYHQQQYHQHYFSQKQHLQESQRTPNIQAQQQPQPPTPQQQQQAQQQRAVNKMPQLRSKSSLERYDPYYYKYYENYGQTPEHQESVSATPQSISSVTSPPHRPWSDYLQQQSQRESSDRNSTAPISPSISSSASSTAISTRQKSQMSTNVMVPDIPQKSQQNQLQREESLQRLLEWKQRMLQSPLTKRNANAKNQSRNTQYNLDGTSEIPARPPLPKEYKTKVSMMYKDNERCEDTRKETNEPSMPRERSKSFGNVNSGSKDRSVDCYSSDDEGNPPLTMPEPSVRRRKRHQSGKNSLYEDRCSPEYMNLASFQNCCQEDLLRLDVRSGGDGQEDDKSSLGTPKGEKLYHTPTGVYPCPEEPVLKRANSCNDISNLDKLEQEPLDVVKHTEGFGSMFAKSENLTRGHLRVSFRSALKGCPSSESLSGKTKLPPTPPPKPTKVASDEDEKLKCSKDKQPGITSYEDALAEDGEEDVISKLVKFYNAQKTRPAPNFVKDRIKSIEMENETPSKHHLKHVSGVSCGISSDTELLESRKQEEDDNTTKSAPVTFSPLSSVLADLRKTADARKEQLYVEEKEQAGSSTTTVEDPDAIINSNYQVPKELSDNYETKINDEEDHGYLTMESKLSGNGDELYVPMSPFVNESNKEKSFTAFDYENDAGADADDEASRDFDSIQYQNDLLKVSSLPDSSSNDCLMGERTREAEICVEATNCSLIRDDGAILFGSDSQESLKPTSHYSSFLSQSWIKDLLNPNPAYECLEPLRVCTARSVTAEEMKGEKKASCNAPYYYSDLLTEAEMESLQNRLVACHGSSPPSLLSRSNALNNTRFLGTTSFQKTDVGKKVNKIKSTESSLSPVSSPVTNVLDLIPDDYSAKFRDVKRNEYIAGSTLPKVPLNEKRDHKQEAAKRCLTPDTVINVEGVSERSGAENKMNILRRRSRSLTDLNLESDPVYENMDAFIESQENEGIENERGRTDVPLLESISKKCFDFEENVVRKSSEDLDDVDSDKSSIIELGGDLPYLPRKSNSYYKDFLLSGSQTGSFYGHKVRRRRSSRSSRSKDDVNNVSDSETASKPPPPPPLPIGYNDYGYPYYNLNEPLKHQQKLSRSVGTGLQYQDQDPLRSRLCVSAGDLIGKSHEELVLLLIQMRRNQSHLASTCDQLRLQMESEEKLIEIEPYKREEHKARFRELREKLVEAEREYNLRFPVINMIDNMVKLNYGTSTGSVQELADNKDEEDLLRDKSASTSFLDKLPEKREDRDGKEDQAKDKTERHSDGVENNLKKAACSPSSSTSSSSSDIEKMKKQQNMLESELGRVRGLLVQSAKRLEERAAENAKIEQDMMVAKTKLNQVLCSPSSSSSTSYNVENQFLEAELESIDKAIDDLHAKRKEILESYRKNKMDTNMIVRASPTGLAGSAALPEKKKRPATSYMETDIDSLESRDLAQYFYYRYLMSCDGDPGSVPLYENLESHLLYNVDEKKEFGNEKGSIVNGESGA